MRPMEDVGGGHLLRRADPPRNGQSIRAWPSTVRRELEGREQGQRHDLGQERDRLGPVGFIAQNGIQVGYGAAASITENAVTGNVHTQGAATGYVSSGIRLYQANLSTSVGAIAASNHSYGNQANIVYINVGPGCQLGGLIRT